MGRGNRQQKRRMWEDAPEEVIQLIQSFLFYHEAIRTSLVSKAWLRAFSTIHVLRFDQPYRSNLRFPMQTEPFKIRFVNLVEKTLQRYCQENIPIEKLELYVSILSNFENRIFIKNNNIDNWIRMISTKRGLKEFHLSISGGYKTSYSFPSEIFVCETLKTFTLIGSPGHVSMCVNHSEIKCHSLRHLKLYWVILSDETVNVLLASLPIIEKLIIDHCQGLKTIEVPKLCHLQEFKFINILYFPFVHVAMDVVPCLESFSFGGEGSFNINTVHSLKHLSLDNVAIDDDKFQTMLSECNLLELLKLYCCKLSKRIKISGASLKELFLFYCGGLPNLNICAPNLVLISLKGSSFPTLSYADGFPTNFKTISKFDCITGPVSFSGLREVLIRSRVFHLGIHSPNDIALRQLRAIVLSPPQNLEILLLILDRSISEYSSILDTLFSIFRPKYFAVFADLNPGFYKFLSAQLGEQTHPDCCTSQGLSKCWRHYLKVIEFEMGMRSIEGLWQFEVGWRGGELSCCYKLTWGDSTSL